MNRKQLLASLLFTPALYAAPNLIHDTSLNRVRLTASDRLLFTSVPETDESSALSLLRNEAAVRAESGHLNFSIGLSNRFQPTADEPAANRPLVLEKKTLAYEADILQIKAGDTHQELGRGIALSLYRDDVFGVDNTVEGAAVSVTPGDFELGAFGGRVNSLRVPVAQNPLENPVLDRTVWLGGVHGRARLTDGAKVGAHYLLALNEPLQTKRTDVRWNTAGATLEANGLADGAVDLYIESNALVTERIGARNEVLPVAYGSYASLSYAVADWKLKLEAKDYRDYDFEFRRPPTLEEDVVASPNVSRVTAARLTSERRFGGPTSKDRVFASYLGGNDRQTKSQLHHAVVGGKLVGWAASEWEAKAGYRWFPDQSRLTHGSLKTKLRTFVGQSLELGYRKQHLLTGLSRIAVTDDRNYFDLTYTFSQNFTLNLGYEFVPSNVSSVGNHFPNIGATARLGDVSGRAFVGQTSGGTLCSGGVCRQIPAFTGALVEGTYVF